MKVEIQQDMKKIFIMDIAWLLYPLDAAKGKLEPREWLQEILLDIWNQKGRGYTPRGSSNQLAELLKEGVCPGLMAYLKQAAKNNEVLEVDLLRQTGKLYDVLCEYQHSETDGDTNSEPEEDDGDTTSVLVEKYKSGRTNLLAFAVLASFSGRELLIYNHFRGRGVRLVLRRVLWNSWSATQEEVSAFEPLERMIVFKEIPLPRNI
jgi:hypothetical protein